MTDQAQQRDPLVVLVEKRLADGAPVSEALAAVLDQLALDLPPSYRLGVQGEYRAWLRNRARDARREQRTGGPVFGELGRWQ